KCIFNVRFFQQWPLPVLLKRQQAVGNSLLESRTDEIATIFTQDVAHLGSLIPSQSAPDAFIDIVVTSLGIRDEADRMWSAQGKDTGHALGTGIADLAPLGERECEIPVGHRILTVPAMRDVGIIAYRKTSGNRVAEVSQAHTDLRSV